MPNTDPNCIFCKIVRKEIPADEVLRDEHVVAFRDLNPQAPTHVLVIPTEHAAHLSDFTQNGRRRAPSRLLAPRPRSAAASAATATAS